LYLCDCAPEQGLQPVLRDGKGKLIDRLRLWTSGLRAGELRR